MTPLANSLVLNTRPRRDVTRVSVLRGLRIGHGRLRSCLLLQRPGHGGLGRDSVLATQAACATAHAFGLGRLLVRGGEALALASARRGRPLHRVLHVWPVQLRGAATAGRPIGLVMLHDCFFVDSSTGLACRRTQAAQSATDTGTAAHCQCGSSPSTDAWFYLSTMVLMARIGARAGRE